MRYKEGLQLEDKVLCPVPPPLLDGLVPQPAVCPRILSVTEKVYGKGEEKERKWVLVRRVLG